MFKSLSILISVLFLLSFNLLLSQEIKYDFVGEMYFPSSVILDQVEIFNNEKYSPKENIEKTIDKILNFYSNSGFPLCEIKVIDLNSDYCKIEINSGEYVRMLFIEFEGNRICDIDFLIRETRLEIGSKFSEEKVNIAMNYLYKTGLFKSKPEYSIVKNEGKLGLKIVLNEKKYFKGMFLGGINNSDDGAEFVGSGEFFAENILGTNRKAGIKWFKKNETDEKIHLMYREPFILAYPISNRFVFEQENLDLQYLKRKYELFTEWTINPESDIFVSYSQENIYPDSSNAYIDSDVNINKYLGGLKYSTLYDLVLIPKDSGFSLAGSISSINTEFAGKDSINNAIGITVNMKKVFKIDKRIFFMTNNEYSQVLSSETIDSFSKIVFGGAYGLRGYNDESFISDIKLHTESELIFTPINDLGLGCFIDVAGFNPNNEKIKNFEDLEYKFGYGIVLSYLKNSNEIQFTIGIPGQKGFSESMIHVKYSYRF
jgi:outer membrane protein assembly factor BamA